MDGLQVTLGNLGKMPRSMNSGLTFLLVLQGSIQVEHNAVITTMEKNDILALGHKDIYAVTGEKSNVVLMVSLSRELMEGQCPEAARYSYRCNSAEAGDDAELLYAALKKHVAQIGFLFYKQEEGHDLLMHSAMFRALYHLLDFREKESVSIEEQSAEGQRISAILAYIHQNYKSRISLEEIAAREYMSVQYVSKMFRQKMGVTFLAYLTSLRLQSAMTDLLYTKASITQIAMHNGFANAKAFNQQFKRQYGQSPFEYRKIHQAETKLAEAPEIRLLQADTKDSLEALVKFIDVQSRAGESPANVERSIDLAAAEGRPIRRPKGIVDIGDLSLALRADTRRQLTVATANMKLDCVYFSGFLQPQLGVRSDVAAFQIYDFYKVFTLFNQIGLAPFIRIELDHLHNPEMFADFSAGLWQLGTQLSTLKQQYGPESLMDWHIEVVGTPRQLEQDFGQVWQQIGRIVPEIPVGVRVEIEQAQEQDTRWLLGRQDILDGAKFLTFSLDPNGENVPTDPRAFAAFHQGYHLRRVQCLRQWMAEAGMANVPLYLIEWNTLTGRSVVEAGEFHRTALVTDAMAGLANELDGAGVQLSLFSGRHMEGGLLTHPLSLFLYGGIQRPMFFVHKAFSSLKEQVVYHRDHIIATCDGWDRYAFLVYNPCYIDPFQSLDSLRRKVGSKTMRLTLTGLKPGRYRMKTFLMDKDNGSLYHSWVKIDFSHPLDEEDIDEYMEHASSPAVGLFEIEIEDSYTITRELTLNATALFVLKRYGDL